MAGIISFGAYIPRRRLQRRAVYEANKWFAPGLGGLAKGERAVANWDEDSITMAVEAARDCLGDGDRAHVASVMLASTSMPYIDRQNAGIVKEALNLQDEIGTLDFTGSQKAGTGMLLQALSAAAAGDGPVLAAAAEKRSARPASEDELVFGDAAACFLVGAQDGVARLVARHSIASDFVDHFRAEGESFDYGWEARWVREEGHAKLAGAAIDGLLRKADLSGSAVDHLIVGIPAKGVAAMLAKKAGIRPEAVRDDLQPRVGNAGTAHPLLMLADALEGAAPGERILVLGFGQGADALLFETTAAIGEGKPVMGVSGWLARAEAEANYCKYLSFAGHLDLEKGKRADVDQKPILTALYRNRKTVLGLVGGRCTQTGTVQFPRSELSVNQNDPARGTQEDYPLAEVTARILTFTADNLTYTPDPPNYYGMVEFDGGGRMLTEFTDVNADQVAVGAEMRMMFRIKAVDERSGFTKYFWKAVPAVGRT